MNDELNLDKEGSIWIMESIEEDLKRVYHHFRSITNENERLRKKNEELKSEAYKDEELLKMKTEYDSMKEDYYRGFPITKEEESKINEWVSKLPPANTGTIGGRFKYVFYPTSIGTSAKIVDGVTGQELTFRDLI